jgi:hypothetical protein
MRRPAASDCDCIIQVLHIDSARYSKSERVSAELPKNLFINLSHMPMANVHPCNLSGKYEYSLYILVNPNMADFGAGTTENTVVRFLIVGSAARLSFVS